MNENNSILRLALPAVARLWTRTKFRPGSESSASVLSRLMDCFFYLGLSIALLLAVLTCNGWLGLAIHCLALSGAAALLEKTTSKTTSKPTPAFSGLEIFEGDATCAVVTRETI